MGVLRINGTIDIAQFWPIGSSDADTTKIKLIVNENSFEYKSKDDTVFLPVSIFWDATSKGQVSKSVVTTSKKTGDKTITVRLQGVDTPELHYRAAPLNKSDDVSDQKRNIFNQLNKERRQCFAESATVALANHLKQFADSEGLIDAIFETSVKNPSDSVDTYGRFVGNIRTGNNHDINLWLIENGWGHPAFYTSMSKKEIETVLDAWETGKKKPDRPGIVISNDVNDFDYELFYREPQKDKKIDFVIGEDKGKVLMPKIYRRQVSWLIAKKADVISASGNFKSYLKKKPDELILLKDFFNNKTQRVNLDEYISSDNIILKNPDEFVFYDKEGFLINSAGELITGWK